MELMYIETEDFTVGHINDIRQDRLNNIKVEYIKLVCECMYEDKLDNIQTFKDFCDNCELEERFKWENAFKSIIEDNKSWY